MKIFVTGASGFIGSKFISQLSSRLDPQDQIFCLSRRPQNFSKAQIISVSGDLQGIEKHSDLISGCDYVFHIGAEARYGSDLDYVGHNVIPTQKLVDIVKSSSRLKNFVFLSTIGALDRASNDNCAQPLTNDSTPSPQSAYGRSKLEGESYIRNNIKNFTIIRPTWVYGSGMRSDSHVRALGQMILKKPWLAKLNFPGHVSLVHADQLSQALVNSIGNEAIVGKTYLAVTESYSIGYLLKNLYGVLFGQSPKQWFVPRFSFLFSKIHSLLPLSLVNLFLSYLWAKDENFQKDFRVESKGMLDSGLREIKNDIVKNPNFIITGANSGMGFDLAKMMRASGYDVCCIDREVQNLKSENFSEVYKVDLSQNEEIDRFLEEYSRDVDGLVNNAGVGFMGDFGAQPWEQLERTIDVNIRGALFLTHRILPRLRKSKGYVVNILSSTALFPLPHMALYSASKSFMLYWSESLGVEEKDLTVISICPSGTRTNFQQRAGVRETRGLISSELAAQYIFESIRKKNKFVLFGLKSKILVFVMNFLSWRRTARLAGKLFTAIQR